VARRGQSDISRGASHVGASIDVVQGIGLWYKDFGSFKMCGEGESL